jgi:exopolyphosphatase/guanosine-5'-triphosphate,3'-diphosphate pyrophosphatase
MRVAAIDCGTNSIRLLIADRSADGPSVEVTRQMQVVRLGQDVDRTGRLAPEAIERTRLALVDYVATIRANGVDAVRMVATSATRDAANRAAFVAMVRATLGADPEVITGEEEARLSFAGAASGFPGTLLVADIGGGSTELVLGGDGRLQSDSMDIGCVRLTERRLHSDPPTVAEIAAASDDISTAIASARTRVPIEQAATFIGVAGTVTTIAAIALGLSEYSAMAIHGSSMSAATVHDVAARLVELPRAERAAIPVMHPGRVDVIAAGALILDALMTATGSEQIIASEHDILDGIAASIS